MHATSFREIKLESSFLEQWLDPTWLWCMEKNWKLLRDVMGR